jgi:uncharacterized protein YbjT (DUF2867 family)
MYAVAGVTGHTGSVVARSLLERGEAVRVLVRDPTQGTEWDGRGAEVALADLADPAAVAAALRDTRGAFLLSPPDLGAVDFFASRRRLLEAVADGVHASGVPHVVFLSSLGAHLAAGTGPIRILHEAEQRLPGTVPGITFLRAGYFVANWGVVLGAVLQQGLLPSFFPADLPVPTVSTNDIGRVAADALLDPVEGVRVIELAGPKEATAGDVAAELSRLLGRSVTVTEAPLEAVVPTFTSMGISADVAGLYREMVASLNAGDLRWEGSVPLRRGNEPLGESLAALLPVSPEP